MAASEVTRISVTEGPAKLDVVLVRDDLTTRWHVVAPAALDGGGWDFYDRDQAVAATEMLAGALSRAMAAREEADAMFRRAFDAMDAAHRAHRMSAVAPEARADR